MFSQITFNFAQFQNFLIVEENWLVQFIQFLIIYAPNATSQSFSFRAGPLLLSVDDIHPITLNQSNIDGWMDDWYSYKIFESNNGSLWNLFFSSLHSLS